MNRIEAARLLAIVTAEDNRKADEATVDVWQKVLDDVTFQDAREALLQHWKTSGEYVKPFHVRRIAGQIAAERDTVRRAETSTLAEQPAEPSGRGEQIIRYVLDGLTRARPSLPPARTTDEWAARQAIAAETGERLMREALAKWPDPHPPATRRVPCQAKDCGCTHDLDPATGQRCEAGWLTQAQAPQHQPSLIDDDVPPPPAIPDGQVAPCPTCAPERARIVGEGGRRTTVQARLRTRKAR